MPALDARAPFSPEDVTPITDLIGDARIVAIGENNHHIREFGELRLRLLRHLVEERGFTVLGFESGFAEGELVDAWLRGAPGDVGDVGDVARDGFTFTLGDSPEAHAMLTWLRSHGGVRYAGLDVPSSGGSPVPALQAVRRYLDDVDPGAVTLVDAALAATEPYASVSSAVAPGRHAAMDAPARDAATAALTVLLAHLRALAPVYPDAVAHAVAEHHALGALRVDTYLRELAVMVSGAAPAMTASSRDTYLASTVKLLRRLHGEGAKIVVMVHNGHLQRVPFAPLPGLAFPSAGTHLAAEFGDDYFAVGVTAGTGTTTGLAPDDGERLGFRVYAEDLPPAADGSAEAALAGSGPCVADLRADRSAGPTSLRHANQFTSVDVGQAFDALVYLPEMSVSGHVNGAGAGQPIG